MAQPTRVVKDPGITVGPYRIFLRSDGQHIVYDDRLPIGRRTSAVRALRDAAVAEAQRLVDIGAPLLLVEDSTAAPPGFRAPVALPVIDDDQQSATDGDDE